MATAALLFNGIQYDFAVVDQAIAWATQNNGELVGLFLRAEQEAAEGYIFPSDLDEAENLKSTEDASASHGAIIGSNKRMLEHTLQSNNIVFTTAILTEPDADMLEDKTEGCDKIFTSDKVEETGILTVTGINLESWLKESKIPVERIKN